MLPSGKGASGAHDAHRDGGGLGPGSPGRVGDRHQHAEATQRARFELFFTVDVGGSHHFQLDDNSQLTVIVLAREPNGGYSQIGCTETLECENGQTRWEFRLATQMDLIFETAQILRLVLFDSSKSIETDDGSHIAAECATGLLGECATGLLGECHILLSEVVTGFKSKREVYLRPATAGSESRGVDERPFYVISHQEAPPPWAHGTIEVWAHQMQQGIVVMKLHGASLAGKDLFKRSADPFFRILRDIGDGETVMVAQSETVKGDLCPEWRPVSIDVMLLCNGVLHQEFIIEVVDYHHTSKGGVYRAHDPIGYGRISLSALLDPNGPRSLRLLHPAGKKKDVGSITFQSIELRSGESIVDRVADGWTIESTFAIDFTRANRHYQAEGSFHALDTLVANRYQRTMIELGQILAPFSASGRFGLIGFGGSLRDDMCRQGRGWFAAGVGFTENSIANGVTTIASVGGGDSKGAATAMGGSDGKAIVTAGSGDGGGSGSRGGDASAGESRHEPQRAAASHYDSDDSSSDSVVSDDDSGAAGGGDGIADLDNSSVSSEGDGNDLDGVGVEGVQGLLYAYSHCVVRCTLEGATNIGPPIDHVASLASRKDVAKRYFIVILAIADDVMDVELAMGSIARASALPMSVVLVAVGRGDFPRAQSLGSSTDPIVGPSGERCVRRIVTFAKLKQDTNVTNGDSINGGGGRLGGGADDADLLVNEFTHSALADIPRQLHEYRTFARNRQTSNYTGGSYQRPSHVRYHGTSPGHMHAAQSPHGQSPHGHSPQQQEPGQINPDNEKLGTA